MKYPEDVTDCRGVARSMQRGAGVSLRTEAATVLAILAMVLGTMLAGSGVGYVISAATGFGLALELPVALRLLGALLAGAGILSAAAVLRVRSPLDVLDSTAVTMRKLYHRIPLERPQERREPFVPKGPHRFVRNPIYMGVVSIVFGLALLLEWSVGLFWGGVLVVWFWFAWIPYEECELEALFGESYARYRRRVPKLFPDKRSFQDSG